MKQQEFKEKLDRAKILCANVIDENIQKIYLKNQERALFELAKRINCGEIFNISQELIHLARHLFPWATYDAVYLSYETRMNYYYTSVYILQQAEEARLTHKKGLTLEQIELLIKKYRAPKNILAILLDHQALFLEDAVYKRSQVEVYNFRSVASYYNLDIDTKVKKLKEEPVLDLDVNNSSDSNLNMLRMAYIKGLHPNYAVKMCAYQTSMVSDIYNPQFVAVLTSPGVLTVYPNIHNYVGYKKTLGGRKNYLCNDYNLGLSDEELEILVLQEQALTC